MGDPTKACIACNSEKADISCECNAGWSGADCNTKDSDKKKEEEKDKNGFI